MKPDSTIKRRAWIGVASVILMGVAGSPVLAADDREAPITRTDPAADIADLYAWHDASRNKLVTVITYNGLAPAMKKAEATRDAGVVYTVHIDNTGDFVPDIDVFVQFVRKGDRMDDESGSSGSSDKSGKSDKSKKSKKSDKSGKSDKSKKSRKAESPRWMMMIENLPGCDEAVLVPVDRKVRLRNGNKVFSGLFDDPFFFDLEGFLNTLQTGTLSFDGTRDSVAGTNASAIVLEMDLAAAMQSGSTLNIWTTTSRK